MGAGGALMTNPNEDLRPSLWVGHIVLGVADPKASKEFFLSLGLRDVEPEAPIGILELRGGTHLLLLPSADPVEPGAAAPFDLMVDDIEVYRELLVSRGYAPSEIASRDFHRSLTVDEPGGHRVTINSSHVGDQPV